MQKYGVSEKLGQQDDLCALVRRFADGGFGLRVVGVDVPSAGELGCCDGDWARGATEVLWFHGATLP